MRAIYNLNNGWAFSKNCTTLPNEMPSYWEVVNLPHTWNALDGQDGGSDYHRGACWYVKSFHKPVGQQVFIEFQAAANAATVYINGNQVTYHEGGYSTFRANITDLLKETENLIAVCVDNSQKDNIYPQVADFTFYGGIYRDVNLITVAESHFDLDYYGSQGITVTTEVKEQDAVINLEAFLTNPMQGQTVEFQIKDREGNIVASTSCIAKESTKAKVIIPNVHLWHGIADPYLYTVNALLVVHNEVIDEVSSRFGVRTFSVDPQKGFFLNGVLTPLRGVSRHQDFLGIGNALTPEHHLLDMELIKEVGANTIRLAHYQHDQKFYDACDEAGMVVWAEIPFISVFNEALGAHQNCISQMKELIVQNYNHPSIMFWGIANEITMGGENPKLLDNLKKLNDLVHEMDPYRLSTIAQLSMVPKDSSMNYITNVVSYNHYFGWYGGTLDQNEKWLDEFHAMHPNIPLGLSEYGAEGIITYHNDDPKVKDYSEDYQAIYHEHMAKIIDERPWLWATHVWNMFDFGCDARDEGGVKGRNNKGLVTLDRKIKKDSFYLYKAFWSNEAFIHVCGHRYSIRTGETTTVKVYSNQPEVALYVDGKLFEAKKANRIFIFENVPLKEETTLIYAKTGDLYDSMSIQKAAEPNPEYILVEEDEGDGVANWFNLDDYKDVTTLEFKEGYFSIKDKIGDIMANEEAGNLLIQVISTTTGMKLKRSMFGMMKDMSFETLAGMMGDNASEAKQKDMLPIINNVLNKIKK